MVTAAQAGRYLEEYVRRYRREYERFTAPPPDGGGYPRLRVSPYVTGGRLECHLAVDGAVVLEASEGPAANWHIAGGPAIMADFSDSRTPEWVTDIVEAQGLAGERVGIYRVVSQDGIPDHVWHGSLGGPTQSYSGAVGNVTLDVFRYRYRWDELIRRLTFGVLELILDIHLPDPASEFWTARIIRNLGFLPADRSARRFFQYAELLRHTDAAAWDPRSAWARAHVDLRRDFAHAAAAPAQEGGGGSLSFTTAEPPLGPLVRDRLERLRIAADGLERLLASRGDEAESVFHDYLLKNPILLDVYGHADSKPRLSYPPGESPSGKNYVEPDFILKYWNQTYRLIELERPGHRLATQEGHPRVGVTHAAYQIAEWKDFIDRNYHLLSARYPGIAGNYTSAIVIGRDSQAVVGQSGDVLRYMSLLRKQLAVDEVLTYDDLVRKARVAMGQLQTLADSTPDAVHRED